MLPWVSCDIDRANQLTMKDAIFCSKSDSELMELSSEKNNRKKLVVIKPFSM